MNHDEAAEAARTVYKALRPAFSKLTVAGSLRRHRPVIKDIEMVALPVMGGLYDDVPDLTAVDAAIERAIASGLIAWDMQLRRNGERYKRFKVPSAQNIVIDFFIASPVNFGCILAIRTGDKDFSHALVTQQSAGGLMPAGMQQKDGVLLRAGEIVPCFTEEEYFEALGLPHLIPTLRNAEGVQRLRREIGPT